MAPRSTMRRMPQARSSRCSTGAGARADTGALAAVVAVTGAGAAAAFAGCAIVRTRAGCAPAGKRRSAYDVIGPVAQAAGPQFFVAPGFPNVSSVREETPPGRQRPKPERDMRRSILTIAAIAASVFVLGKADAMPLNGGLGDAADRLSAVEKTQFVYLGRNYCW